MSATELQLNEELFTALAELSHDEGLLRKAVSALKRIISQAKQADPTLMTKDTI